MKIPGISLLDFKLGLRMLRKYPGLTLVGGVAIAFAICVGAGTFEFLTRVVYPAIPLPHGERIVGILQWDEAANRERTPTAHDFAGWRGELRSVDDLGAFRTVERNLIAANVPAAPIAVAEMTASGFRVARVPPLMGRPLVAEDEAEGAPAVAVIGHGVWTEHFGGDPGVIGREIRLGAAVHTVVGVMPEGFAFPISHELWTPLRIRAGEHAKSPPVRVFGRLAPGAEMAAAQAELATLGRRAAADHPATHQHLRPLVLPYGRSILYLSTAVSAAVMSMNLFLVLLLVLVCSNVALLIFARAAAREGEIVVRNALGASRGRIIAQLFAEALVLAGVGAAVGLAAAGTALEWMLSAFRAEGEVAAVAGLPFWIAGGISPATVLYAAGLTVLGALVAGVLPALKVTRGLGSRLRQATAGGFRFGGVWTVVIVAQVAVTVAFPAVALFVQRETARTESRDVGFATAEYLSARLEADEAAPGAIRELERRLEADPAVRGVTFADRLPRMHHPHRRIELDAGGAAPVDPEFGYRRVSSAAVAPDYFDVLGAGIVRGRGFHSGDLAPGSRAILVNQSFVERVLGGRNPIGRHVRVVHREEWEEPRAADGEPWYEIVGVVRDLGMGAPPDPKVAGFYHPAAPGAGSPLHMAVHVAGKPEVLAGRLRAIAAAVDPSLRLYDVGPLDEATADRVLDFSFWLVVGVSAVALLLALAGIYSVMAFTVAQRTREIGIRVALGADARRIVGAIFRRPLRQVAAGIVAGGALVAAFPVVLEMEALSARGVALAVAYAMLMMCICLLACIVPTRRALSIEPSEALRADA